MELQPQPTENAIHKIYISRSALTGRSCTLPGPHGQCLIQQNTLAQGLSNRKRQQAAANFTLYRRDHPQPLYQTLIAGGRNGLATKIVRRSMSQSGSS